MPNRKAKAFFFLILLTLGLLFTFLSVWNTQSIKTQTTPARAETWPQVPSQPTGQPKAQRKEDKAGVEELLQVLQSRIQNYSGPKLDWKTNICKKNLTGSSTCYDADCPGHFSTSLKGRLQQVLSTRAPIPAQYLQALASAARRVTSHKYIFVTGASSNHYNELQALLDNVFHTLFPLMKGKDYAFVFYDLGLTPNQRKLTEKHCRCTVIDFPFEGLPPFVRHLKCYAWKPLIVASLLEKAEYLVWMDASIRWRNSTPIADLFSRAKASGYLTNHNQGTIAVRSQASMAQFFGDYLCQYAPFSEMETGLGFYYNDRFMREAILLPWLSCAFNTNCMCVKNFLQLRNCAKRKIPRYGTCHRFEQSSIGMIFSKLFLENRPMLYVPRGSVSVRRGHTMKWFESAGSG